jgi:hypothetical protein
MAQVVPVGQPYHSSATRWSSQVLEYVIHSPELAAHGVKSWTLREELIYSKLACGEESGRYLHRAEKVAVLG